MCRILFGIVGQAGDSMREADLSVYHGIPFAKTTGRKRISSAKSISKQEEYMTVSSYWRDKIREESKAIMRKKREPLKFIFNKAEFEYHESKKST